MKSLRPLCESLLIHGLLMGLLMPVVGRLSELPQEQALDGMRLDFSLATTTGHLAAGEGIEKTVQSAPAEKEVFRSQPASVVKSDVQVHVEPKRAPKALPQPEVLPEPVVQKQVKVKAPAPSPHSRPESKVQTEPLIEPVIPREDIIAEQLDSQELPVSSGETAAQLEKTVLESSVASLPVSVQTPVATTTLTQSDSPTEATLDGSGVPSFAEMALDDYRKANYAAIRQSIYEQLHYPRLAQRRGWKGRIEILFRVATDGTLLNAEVLHSSGYPLLDKQALKAVSEAAPFTPPPMISQFLMPVIFELQ
ncbi:energy transducer TonB [uncultured Desulfuromusa sp.]|uniref:energy transducer TonB n=1 Tax=uncultured Desulfuromusa sp. TaxID=219183 RepID=UPI002AA7059F|nr:energy transducer TonB [uncultured Desulfuromusa sp.]